MTESKEKGLETLLVWQKSLDFATHVCREVLPKFPVEERWALASQLRRSVQSIPANIAEGFGRYYYQDSVRFCYISRGSLLETFSHLTLASRLEYLPQTDYAALVDNLKELQRMLNGYIDYLKKSKRGEHEPGSKPGLHEEPSLYLVDPDQLTDENGL